MSIAEFAQREQVAILYADHHRWLQTWLRRRLGDSCAAADVAHDTFLRIIVSRDALLGLREPRAYLATTAKRLLVDRSRRQLIEQAYLQELALAAQSHPGFPSPDEILMAVQALEQIDAALQGLAARPREAFLRHYLEEQTQAAIALDLGVSKRMVQKYLAQALLHCRGYCPAVQEHGAG
ncbi:sigma-70 family RNA polymerase sigma factor [Achromobacter sp. Marseille-Q0513]|uniref:sigma-70 family RNA polymerase sigma factor n=1 Tax=Achromobacter sp. Marseille-Q0513 TaxID=2829161 RepID=UPI001BA283AC|nr:sigma-70 family RNA polymerase sigma factor [Achromobacter sp. Marseille-Q0513]MBR8653596.1 sigma-70 family RNA polymerase sigma factor [Achromobacter sp. Marseille-Q0513]